jgi:hypothetical protein
MVMDTTNVIAGSISVLLGLTFIIFYKKLAVISATGNKKWFGLPFPLDNYEWGFRISGVVLVLFGIALVVGLLRIAK